MAENSTDTSHDASKNEQKKVVTKTQTEASLLRGSLKLETSASTPIVSAGSEFSIYVVIRNPFSIPVTIFSTETHIPVELSDENWRKNQGLHIRQGRSVELSKIASAYQKLLQHMIWWFSDFINSTSPDSGPRVAVAVTTEVQESISRPESSLYVNGSVDTGGGDFITGNRWDLDFGDRSSEDIHRILFEINEFMLGRSPVILNAGDSVVKHFILKTTRWLTFTPIAYTFQIQVRYEIDSAIHVDTVPFALNIRAAIGSSLVGAVIGSVLGSLVNPNTDFTTWLTLGRSVLIAIIFAIIVVVAFARKSNVQQIVSVEDFWGGIFIGFLVGYTGSAFINSVL